MTKAHSPFSASSSERWLACPGSVELSKDAPPQFESKYAAEGTEAHECVEAFLKTEVREWDVAYDQLVCEHPVEMVAFAMDAAKMIIESMPPGATLLCETKVSLEYLRPGMFGTVDAAIIEEFGELQVIDFKYGAGHAVEVANNPQLIYYALGLAQKYDFMFDKVTLRVLQPRADHPDGPDRRFTMSVADLRAWEKVFGEGVDRALQPNAPLVAHKKHCKWCPAKTICPEISDAKFREAQIAFAPQEGLEVGLVEAPVFKIPRSLALPELPKILKAIPSIKEWCESVEEYAFQLLVKKTKIPGFKLVEKQGKRAWINATEAERQAIAAFGEQALTQPVPQLLSPNQLEKAFGKKAKEFTKSRTASVSSGLTMAPEDDPRPEASSAQEAFKDAPMIELEEKPKSEADWRNEAKQTTKRKKTK